MLVRPFAGGCVSGGPVFWCVWLAAQFRNAVVQRFCTVSPIAFAKLMAGAMMFTALLALTVAVPCDVVTVTSPVVVAITLPVPVYSRSPFACRRSRDIDGLEISTSPATTGEAPFGNCVAGGWALS